LRVLDLVAGSAGAYAGKLLGMLGADVVIVEPPEGDSLRFQTPFLDGVPGIERSLGWNHRAVNARSLVLDLNDPDDRLAARDLAVGSDVLLENRSSEWLQARELDEPSLRGDAPELVYTSMSPFGRTGPRAGWIGGDLVAYAAGGMMALTGEPDAAPVRLAGAQGEHLTGLYAAMATLAALASRAVTGAGQHVDVSMQESVACSFVDAGFSLPQVDGSHPCRNGTQHPLIVPLFSAPAADGVAIINCPMPNQFGVVLNWLAECGVEVPDEMRAALPSLPARLPLRAMINETISRATRQHPKEHIYRTLQSRSAPAAPVNTAADVITSKQLLDRDFFDSIELTTPGRKAALPRPPFRFSGTALGATRPAPTLGRTDLPAGSGVRPTPSARRRGAPNGTGPLAGLRVVDFSWALAGPWTARMLACDGAEVIRVESGRRLDTLRAMGSSPERSPTFIDANAGKRSVALDLTTSGGLDIALRLARTADVVLENFRPGVMDRLGLGYDVLSSDHPELIMCSMPAMGSTGPDRDYVAYGPVLLALSGITGSTGHPDGPSTAIGSGYVDQVSAGHAAVAVLAALAHRDRTGQGQYIELAQLEAAVSVLGSAVLEQFAGAPERGLSGNRDLNAAPHGCYRCAGEDEWLVVSILHDDQWQALARVLDRPDLADDRTLTTLEGRLARQDELDAAIGRWAAPRDKHDAVRMLQAAGVPAGGVTRTAELLTDEHLRARGFFEPVEHPVVGTIDLLRAPYLLSATPNGLTGRAGPLLGADTEDVLRDLLGVTAEEYGALIESGAVDAPTTVMR
jgi:crotonobetainyl-CoA:carnitine CoA-transferase CaiB-like acyl-CoA transferase